MLGFLVNNWRCYWSLCLEAIMKITSLSLVLCTVLSSGFLLVQARIDWTIVIVAGIAAVPTIVASILALKQSKKTHGIVNSRMDELLKLTKSESFRAGKESKK